MNKNQILVVALKIQGILLLIRAVPTFIQFMISLSLLQKMGDVSSFNLLNIFSPTASPVSQAILVVYYVIVGSILLLYPQKISDKLIPEKGNTAISKDALIELVFYFLGFEAIIFSLFPLFRIVTQVLPRLSASDDNTYLLALFIPTLIQLGMGVVFIKYAKKISKFILAKLPSRFWS